MKGNGFFFDEGKKKIEQKKKEGRKDDNLLGPGSCVMMTDNRFIYNAPLIPPQEGKEKRERKKRKKGMKTMVEVYGECYKPNK